MKRLLINNNRTQSLIALGVRNSLPVQKAAATGLVSLLLTSCAMIGEQQPETVAVSRSASSPATITRSEQEQNNIPSLSGANSAEQQALIDEINRDGQPITYSGSREQAPEPEVTQGPDVVELNYEQADLRLVLEELAEALDITLVLDPSIDAQVSIRTAQDRPLQRNDIWPLIRMLTRDAGIVLEQAGENIYNARVVESNLPVELASPQTLGDGSSSRVLQVTPLTFVSADAVLQALQPLVEPDGSVNRLGNNNLLIINGTEFQLQRINELIMLLDADPFATQGIHLYQLSNANATEVATELEEILQLIEGPNPAFQVKGIDRINSVLVTSPAARGFDEISRWVRILDSDSQEQAEQLFMYRVKNLVALELAETLSTVFEEDEEALPPVIVEDEVTDLPDAVPEAEPGSEALEEPAPEAPTATPTPGSSAISANLAVRIVADEATNSLLIRATARDYRQLLTTINQLDAVPLQVMVNAVIAQITLNDETRFGVDWSRVAANAETDPISTETSTSFVPQLDGLLFTKSFLDGAARVEATLEAIATNNEVRLLARPSLTVSNNQEGEIQIGAEVPVESGQTIGQGGQSTTNIQYRPTGIELYITPQINSDGVVNLIIRQVLSSVDAAGQGVRNNPVFNNQEISTTVVVRNGENVVLGGLIQDATDNLNTGVPLLNRIPVVGNLFSYQQLSNERRELFIVLRPEIINLNEQTGPAYADIIDRFELAAEVFEEYGL